MFDLRNAFLIETKQRKIEITEKKNTNKLG